jgi:hypothetical protein
MLTKFNALSTGKKAAVILVLLALVGGIGLWVYRTWFDTDDDCPCGCGGTCKDGSTASTPPTSLPTAARDMVTNLDDDVIALPADPEPIVIPEPQASVTSLPTDVQHITDEQRVIQIRNEVNRRIEDLNKCLVDGKTTPQVSADAIARAKFTMVENPGIVTFNGKFFPQPYIANATTLSLELATMLYIFTGYWDLPNGYAKMFLSK